MVPVLAKPGQNGGQILLDDVKTCKKKIILQNAHGFYNLHWEAFLRSTILQNKNTASTKCQRAKKIKSRVTGPMCSNNDRHP